MNLSTTAAFTALALGCSAPASAGARWDGEPALRLPGEPGAQAWTATPSLKLSTWAHDLSERLARIARPPWPELQWRGAGDTARASLSAHWHPWTVGSWRLGAAMGLHRALPASGGGTLGFAAMPMASYEQAHYRMTLGLVPPSDARAPAVLLGLSIPLR